MAFRGAANIDPNQHKGLVISSSITNQPLIATGLSLTNAQPLHVAVVDGSGSQITSFNGGAITGTVTANAGTNLNTSALALESGGNLAAAKLDLDTIATTIGTVAPGTAAAKSTLIGAVYNSTPPALTNGQQASLQLDSDGSLFANVRDALPAGTNSIGFVGSSSGAVNVGQQTVNTSAVQVSASSVTPTNGILIGALSTNSASIFVGGSGVTTSAGAELLPGSILPFTCNLNTLYIISAASTTDKIWWDVV